MSIRFYCYLFFHNTLIIYGIVHQIVLGYFGLYILQFKTFKSDMTTVQKIVNNLINEDLFPLNVSSLRQDGWY